MDAENADTPRTNVYDVYPEISLCYRRITALEAQYHELLLAVEQKFPGESRHDTALRFIREREAKSHEAGTAS